MKLLREQMIAADPSISVWVSANAGTGKTKVLTDRFLRLLLLGEKPEHILCLTYTRAAASEMAQRIRARLASWQKMDDERLACDISSLTGCGANTGESELARTLFSYIADRPGSLRINTIHSFCQTLLRLFPMEAGVAPHTKLADERTCREMLRKTWQDICADFAQDAAHAGVSDNPLDVASALGYGVRYYGSATLENIVTQMVTSRPERLLALLRGGLTEAIERIYEHMDVQISGDEAIINSFIDEAQARHSQLAHALEDVQGAQQDMAREMLHFITKDWQAKTRLMRKYRLLFLTQKDTARKTIFKKATYDAHPSLKPLITQEADALEQLQQRRARLHTARLSHALLVLGASVYSLYKQEKQHRARMDYDDLISHVRTLLEREDIGRWVMYRLDARISHILLDEAQDTSHAQWEIIRMLCEDFFSGDGARSEGRTIFVVGDAKQSIYSFQGADPDMFFSMREFFGRAARDASQRFEEVPLDTSFRSTSAVLRCVDHVFADDTLRAAITRDAQVRHKAHRAGALGRVELWPLFRGNMEDDDTGDAFDPTVIKQHEKPQLIMARHIAATIAKWRADGRRLSSTGDIVKPGDIMILLRKRRDDVILPLLRAFAQYNIPVAGRDRLLLHGDLAVMDMLALSRFMLLPADEYSLACVLKSSLCGIDEEELFAIAYDRGERSLWGALQERDSKQARAACAFLTPLMEMSGRSAYDIFSHVLDALGGRSAFISALGGHTGDVLDNLLSLAAGYERDHTPTLQGFLYWMEQEEAEIKRDMEEGSNAVRIMTAHGAKGLQAPIVILPDTVSDPGGRAESLRWQDAGAPLPFAMARHHDIDISPQQLRDMKDMDAQAQEAESLRLLYVAMTRAEDELYITGVQGARPVGDSSWYKILSSRLPDIMEEGDFTPLPKRDDAQEEKFHHLAEGAEIAPMPDAAHDDGDAITHIPDFLREVEGGRDAPASEDEDDGDEDAQQLGVLVHKMLEIAVRMPAAERDKSLEELALYIDPSADGDMRLKAAGHVANALSCKEFTRLLEHPVMAEVDISGMTDGGYISGRADIIVRCGQEMHIIDYKTTRDIPPDGATHHAAQLASYRALLTDIYPNADIKTAILWTSCARLEYNALPL